MQENSIYIGIGKNPDGPDLPLGFGMQLMQHPSAMHQYGQLSNSEKSTMIEYMQSSKNGVDAKNRIANAITRLDNGEWSV